MTNVPEPAAATTPDDVLTAETVVYGLYAAAATRTAKAAVALISDIPSTPLGDVDFQDRYINDGVGGSLLVNWDLLGADLLAGFGPQTNDAGRNLLLIAAAIGGTTKVHLGVLLGGLDQDDVDLIGAALHYGWAR